MVDFDDLDEAPETYKGAAPKPTHPCTVCNGTGVYRGVRVHQEKTHCFACKGQGYFKTSEFERKKARAARQSKKEAVLAAAQKQNAETGLLSDFDELDMTSWNQFVVSLMEQHRSGRVWSDKQVAAAKRMVAKTRASRKAREEAKAASAVSVDLSAIHTAFAQASQNLKRPSYRAEGVVITKAPDHGRNAGALYVKSEDGEYCGKVSDGKFYAVSTAPDGINEKLLTVAKNPAEAARVYGKVTGKCCCCGRELTNPASIAAGIGPICAESWGF